MWFWGNDLAADFARYRPNQSPSTLRLISVAIGNLGLVTCVILRLQQRASVRGNRRAAESLRSLNVVLTGADFAPGAQIGPGLLMNHPNGIVVGMGVVMGIHCTILQQATLGEKFADGRGPHDYPIVGNRVVIGAGAKVLGGVRLGHNSNVGANAVVNHDVPPHATAVGAPARILLRPPPADNPGKAEHKS